MTQGALPSLLRCRPCRAAWTTLPGRVGLGALALALPLAVGLAPAWRDQAEQAETQRQAQVQAQLLAARRLAVQTEGAAARAGPPGWAKALPDAGQHSSRVAELVALAQRQGLVMHSLQQHTQSAGDNAPGLAAWPLDMRLVGSYAAARGFVAAALQSDPALALGQLRLSRPKSEAGDMDIKMQWWLLAQTASAAARGKAP